VQYEPEPEPVETVTPPEPEPEALSVPREIPKGWEDEWKKLTERATPVGLGIFEKLKQAREKAQ
jgi:hypothetical protein